jgi:hypothetical protein
MSNEELNAQITSLKAELEKMTKIAELTTNVWAKAEDEKIILGRKIEDLEEEVKKWKKISSSQDDKWNLEFNKHMETQRLLDATKEGYDTMLSINKEAIQEIDLLEIKNNKLTNELRHATKERDTHYRDVCLLEHARFCGSYTEEGTLLMEAHDNGLSIEEVIDGYKDYPNIKLGEDYLRKKYKLPTFLDAWKTKFGLEFPKLPEDY